MKRLTSITFALFAAAALHADDFEICKQSRHRETGRVSLTQESWKPAETALIICDMWDSHHSGNAARRTAELAPHLDRFAKSVRASGALVIHAPSSTIDFYRDHPARNRATGIPDAPDLPSDIGTWCHWKDSTEETVGYPVDHSDGGGDDDPRELKAWHAKLQAQGRTVGSPWQRQIATIAIDPDRDAISDSGTEIWNLLHQRNIKNVFLAGVHTNMCVLGRPFGLRQLSRNGKNVVLVRDLTDTMYNPAMRPFVSHFRGTDLVVAHTEQQVCPTVTSDQILRGSTAFRFPADKRKNLVALIAEAEYKTADTLPPFLENNLQDHFKIEFCFPHPKDPNRLLDAGKIAAADLLLVSVRRRTPPTGQLAAIRAHVESGKPVVGIRTSSHAFALRKGSPPDGMSAWPEFDADVLGGNYQGHHGNKLGTSATVAGTAHPVLNGLTKGQTFPTGGSLYINSPLRPGAAVLATGSAESVERDEPVAWVNTPGSGSRVFYTSLGHPDDFSSKAFVTLLSNACLWAAGIPVGR